MFCNTDKILTTMKGFYILSVFFLLQTGCSEEQRAVPTDLGFMIDASASLYDYGFKNELEFVSDIIDKVGPISKDGLRAGVVVYSDKANSRIYMNDHFSTDAFKFAVRNLPYDNAGQTRIDLGFEESKNLFLTDNGARPSSKKVIGLFFSFFLSVN